MVHLVLEFYGALGSRILLTLFRGQGGGGMCQILIPKLLVPHTQQLNFDWGCGGGLRFPRGPCPVQPS